MSHTVPFLTLLILLPAIGAAVLALVGLDRRLPREVPYALAVIASLVTLGFAISALVAMKVHDGGFQLVSNHQTPAPAWACTGTSGWTASPSSSC